MAFWGVEVKPGKPFRQIPSSGVGSQLHLSQATLGLDPTPGERTVVKCHTGTGPEILLCSLTGGQVESCSLDLMFSEDVVFSVTGSTSVFLTGYYMPTEVDEEDFDQEAQEEDESEDEEDDDFEITDGDEDEEEEDDEEDDSEEDESDEEAVPPYTHTAATRAHIEEVEEDEDEKAKAAKPLDEDELDEDGIVRKRLGRELPSAPPKKKQAVQGEPEGKPATAETAPAAVKAQKVKKGKAEGAKEGLKVGEREGKESKQEAGRGKEGGRDSAEKEKEGKGGKEKDEKGGKEKVGKKQGGEAKAVKEKSGLEKAGEDKGSTEGQEKGGKKGKEKGVKVEVKGVTVNGGEAKKSQGAESADLKSGKGGKPTIRKFPNGFQIEELRMGRPNGKQAKPGQKVVVKYVGRLQSNNKIFDSTKGNATFNFRLGVGEVIKGWDAGVQGMRVGDLRRLTVPPGMGYGAKGAPGAIPGNATLVFDVELMDVKA